LLLKLRRKTYVTPRHYLDFIHMYLRLLDEKDSYMKLQVREGRSHRFLDCERLVKYILTDDLHCDI
jgi:hypothetical protein